MIVAPLVILLPLVLVAALVAVATVATRMGRTSFLPSIATVTNRQRWALDLPSWRGSWKCANDALASSNEPLPLGSSL